MKQIDNVKYYTRKETSEMLNISITQLQEHIRKNGIEEKKIEIQRQHGRHKNSICNYRTYHISEKYLQKLKDSIESAKSRNQQKKYTKQSISITLNGKRIKMMNIEDVSNYTDLTIKIISEIISKGKIVNTKIAGEPCFIRCDVDAYMKTSDYKKRHDDLTAERNRRKIITEKRREIEKQAEINAAMDNFPDLSDSSPQNENKIMHTILDEIRKSNTYLVEMLRILKELS